MSNYQNTFKYNVKAVATPLITLVYSVFRIIDIVIGILQLYFQFYFHRVEFYQPLYNFSLLKKKPKRKCVDRAELIFDSLKTFGAGARILDVGCNLGYFSFYFAQRDYLVTGIDSDKHHIAVCNGVKRINKLPVQFLTQEFSIDFIDEIPEHAYDVAFIFSELHHIVYTQGIDYVKTLLEKLLDKIPIVFVELALKDEKTQAPWRVYLPDEAISIFEKCNHTTIKLLGYSLTHLSEVARPVYLLQKKKLL